MIFHSSSQCLREGQLLKFKTFSQTPAWETAHCAHAPLALAVSLQPTLGIRSEDLGEGGDPTAGLKGPATSRQRDAGPPPEAHNVTTAHHLASSLPLPHVGASLAWNLVTCPSSGCSQLEGIGQESGSRCPGQGGRVCSAVASMVRHPCYIKFLKAERLKKEADNTTLYHKFILFF